MFTTWQKKKSIHTLAVLCLALFTLTACSGDYLPEKYLYKANRKARTLDIESATQEEIKEVMDAYLIVTDKWPLSMKAVEAHGAISNLFLSQKEFDAARDELKKIVLNFSNKAEVAARARFSIGKIFELEQRFDEAEQAYTELYGLLPTTREGLMSPLYIAEMYKRLNMPEKASAAYKKALSHYRDKLVELGQIRLSAVLQNYIALTYASQGSWKEAVANWELLVETYPDTMLIGPTYLTLGEIYYDKLKERSKAIEYLERAVGQYPDTDISLRAQSKLVQIYFSSGEYDAVIELAENIAENADNDEIKAQAEMIVAQAFEKKGDWPSAEKRFTSVMEDYPDTVSALKVPLLIAQHFQGEEAAADMDAIYESALLNYQKIIDSDTISERTKQGAFDLSNLIYARQQNWDKIITEMDAIYQNEQESINKRSRALFIKAFLYHTKLDDHAEAERLYTVFLSEFESHPLQNVVEKQLSKLTE
jgi:tetratricopeptide (TPR) repeat protein